MRKEPIIAVAALGALAGCTGEVAPQFTGEIIRIGPERIAGPEGASLFESEPYYLNISWLNHPDSTNIKLLTPTLANSSLEPLPGHYYIASGYFLEKGKVHFTGLNEISRERANELRQLKSVPQQPLTPNTMRWEDTLEFQRRTQTDSITR